MGHNSAIRFLKLTIEVSVIITFHDDEMSVSSDRNWLSCNRNKRELVEILQKLVIGKITILNIKMDQRCEAFKIHAQKCVNALKC